MLMILTKVSLMVHDFASLTLTTYRNISWTPSIFTELFNILICQNEYLSKRLPFIGNCNGKFLIICSIIILDNRPFLACYHLSR